MSSLQPVRMGKVGQLSLLAGFLPLPGPACSSGLACHEEQITTVLIPRIWKGGGIWSSLSLQIFAKRVAETMWQQSAGQAILGGRGVILDQYGLFVLFCSFQSENWYPFCGQCEQKGLRKEWQTSKKKVTYYQPLKFRLHAPFFLLSLKRESSLYFWSWSLWINYSWLWLRPSLLV